MAEKKKFPVLIIVIIVLVVFLAAAGGGAYFFVTKMLADAKSEVKKPRDPGFFVKVGDEKEGLIINIGGVNSGHYLKIGITLEMDPEKKAKAAEGKSLSPEEIKIQDTIVYLLRSQKMEDFDAGKQERLKELIKTEINKSLGDEVILDVYITNFLLQ